MSFAVTNAYAAQTAFMAMANPYRKFFEDVASLADASAKFWDGTVFAPPLRGVNALYDVTSRSLTSYKRRPFDIKNIVVSGKEYFVEEEIVDDKPFMRAIKFNLVDAQGNPIDRNALETLVIAPMSGHFATLLRGTIQRLLVDSEVTITDWKNARNIPVSEGRFDLNSYKDYLVASMQRMGRNTHVIGVCQPTVPLLAAVSQMAEDNDAAQPLSMTLIGGPIAPSANITQPVKLAKDKPLSFFKSMTGKVPMPYDGANRDVYPGFMQLMGFMNMNLSRHTDSHKSYFNHLTRGDGESAQKHREFYDEYMAVMDMPAEFYIETIDKVFQQEGLAHGTLELNGRFIDPGKISRTALMTVEGELDDIAGVGQTSAAHNLISNLPENLKFAHIEPGAGHYGVFNGRKWRENIAPQIIGMMHKVALENGISYDDANYKLPTSWKKPQVDNPTSIQLAPNGP